MGTRQASAVFAGYDCTRITVDSEHAQRIAFDGWKAGEGPDGNSKEKVSFSRFRTLSSSCQPE